MIFLLPLLIFLMCIGAVAGCLTILWAVIYMLLDHFDSKEDVYD